MSIQKAGSFAENNQYYAHLPHLCQVQENSGWPEYALPDQPPGEPVNLSPAISRLFVHMLLCHEWHAGSEQEQWE